MPLDRQLPRGHAELPAAKSGGAGGTGRRLGGILGWLVGKQTVIASKWMLIPLKFGTTL